MIHQRNQKIIISEDQINDEMGLGRNRTEMNPTPNGIEQKVPTIEEESILEELGLGRIFHSSDLVEQNDNDHE